MMEPNELQRRLAEIEIEPLRALASTVGGVAFDEAEYGSRANLSGVRSGPYTFSSRRDSLTIFAVDSKYGPLGEDGAWTGADKTVLAACRRVLKAVKVPSTEVASLHVVSEFGAVAERTSSNEFQTKGPILQRKLARATRTVEGVPVWSSYAIVGLTVKGRIGRAEVHWPQVTQQVGKETRVLQALIERGFEAPKTTGAHVESIEVGILHSPAIGLYMDVVPTIRVVYAPDEEGIGKKPVAYLDRHGQPIELPRVLPPGKGTPMVGRNKP
jgi:hypothetical protein